MHFATRDPGDGRALRYHFDEFMAGWVPELARRLTTYPEFATALRHVQSRDALLLYLEQALYVELLPFARRFFEVRSESVFQGIAASPVDMPPDLVPLLEQSAKEYGVPIRASIRLALRARYRDLRRRVRTLIPAAGTGPVSKLDSDAGTIAVELVEGVDPEGKCDAFWLSGKTIDPAQVLFVLESTNRSLVDVGHAIGAARALGSRIIAVDDFGTKVEGVHTWRPAKLPNWSQDLDSELKGAPRGPRRWLAAALSRLSRRGGFWEAFYRENGVQVVQQFTELSDETAIKRIAIDRVGGIEIGKMRSQFFEVSSAAFLFRHEVAFAWHGAVESILKHVNAGTNFLVVTGYVYDFLLGSLKTEANSLRQELTNPAVKVVIVVFDNHSHAYSHSSVADLEDFYRAIISIAKKRPEVGLIVKSKKPEILAMIPQLADELRELIGVGRCIVLDKPLTSVVSAAIASDVAVGFPASTAACEAALADCRVVMYDPSRAHGHPWTNPAFGIVHETIESFVAMVNTAIGDIGHGRRGMPRERLLEIDPFLDGSAGSRAAMFIGSFLDARSAGRSKAESLQAAVSACGSYVSVVPKMEWRDA